MADQNQMISIDVDAEYQDRVPTDLLLRAVNRVLDNEQIQQSVELSIIITDDETVRRLNREYRDLDEYTDVLSFALEGGDQGFVVPPDNVRRLGEVVISYPRAVQQAEESQHTVDAELALLTVHGTLHLFGYDHAEPEEAAEMRGKEIAALNDVILRDER